MSRKATLDSLFGAKLSRQAEAQLAESALVRKSAGSDQFHNVLGAPNSQASTDAPQRIRSGAIGAMGASLQQLKDTAREVESLRQSMASGAQVVELDPALIDAAPVADRFMHEDDAAHAALTESIRLSGQQVPVLVRPHPAMLGRWQAVYGHRRIRAAQSLGFQVKAIVRSLSDVELAVAQGKENLERRDLSYIEKAFYALGLETAGLDRHTIMQAVGADKADISRYLSVARAVPDDLVRMIGPARKTGRSRWLELVEALEKRKLAKATLAEFMENLHLLSGFSRQDSDGRFRFVLARLAETGQASAKLTSLSTSFAAMHSGIRDPQGYVLTQLKAQGNQHQILVNNVRAPGFATYIAGALPDLYQRWLAAGTANPPDPQE